jgi:hypothetical protein
MEEKQSDVKPPKKSSGQGWPPGIAFGLLLGVVLGVALDNWAEGIGVGVALAIFFGFIGTKR